MSHIKLKTLIAKQLPEFVVSENPGLVQFLEAYYEYLDQRETRTINELRDIDKTLDEFVTYIKNEVDVFGESNYDYIDKLLLIRKIKQVLVAKGSEAAYKFLFKILFDKPVNISYPWDSVLKASDGKWNRDTSLFVRITEGNPIPLIGERVTIVGSIRRIFVYVKNVQFIENDVFEIFIEKNFFGNIEIGDLLDYNGIKGIILSTTVGYEIISPGSGYKIGDLINGSTFANNRTITQILKVTKVDTNGGILELSTLKFGYGYTSDFFLFNSAGTVQRKSNISITRDNVNQFSISDDSQIESYSDFGKIITPNYWFIDGDNSYASSNYVGELLQQFFTQTINTDSPEGEQFALIRFNIGAIAKYQGYYFSNDGFLSDNIYLQDSKFYQKYSYLVTVDERLENYKALVKSFLHPAGMALFGEYSLNSEGILGLDGDFIFDTFDAGVTFSGRNIRLQQNTFGVSDLGGTIRLEPYDLEGYFLEDYNPDTVEQFTGE